MNSNYFLEQIKTISLPNKYTKWYYNIIQKAFLRPQNKRVLNQTIGYIERHHILPKSFHLGGENNINNLVFLTAKEHFIIHWVATKMFVGDLKMKMCFALHSMKRSSRFHQRHFNSKAYETLRKNLKISDKMKSHLSILNTGKIHSQETKEKISKANSREQNPNYGKPMTEERKIKISQTKTGKPFPNWGGNNPEKLKQKLSEMLSGNRNPMFGKSGALNPRSKPVKQINKDTGEVIKIWESANLAVKNLNINKCSISCAARNQNRTAGGFKWKFV